MFKSVDGTNWNIKSVGRPTSNGEEINMATPKVYHRSETSINFGSMAFADTMETITFEIRMGSTDNTF